jgi:hypothetical protein
MIEHLDIGRSGYFFEAKHNLSNNAIDRLFRDLRAQAREPSQNLFRIIRQPFEDTRYSAICFSYERDPSFLVAAAGVVERVFGFLLIVERGPHVALFKSGLDLPSSFKTAFLRAVSSERVERAIARHDAVFEKLRLRNMSISPLTLRSKTLEARDLENAVATNSASRFIPQGYSVRRPDGVYSATPTTGRISVRADRAGVEAIVAWSREISGHLQANAGGVSRFIRAFARPLELSSLPVGVHPTYLGVDVMGLSDALFADGDGVRLVRMVDGVAQELSHPEAEAVLAALDVPFPIVMDDGVHQLRSADGAATIGTIRINKSRIAMRQLEIAEIDGVDVERRSTPVGEDPDAVTLSRYVDRESLFTVLFSDLAIAYIEGALFRDEALAGGGDNFLAHLHSEPALANVGSEKGVFLPAQVEFSPGSVFRVVVDSIATDDVLLCDDLGDEWADFIGVNTTSNPAMISFYHAKHGAQSLSASAFHDSVGQAIKNLGRMSLPPEILPNKLAGWDDRYRNNGVQTQISRMIRGGQPAEIADKLELARAAPDVLQRVFIVTSSLSRAQVEGVFAAAAEGAAPSPHFVQLYWLLMSFFSACVEMGVRGYVVCRP